MYERMLNKNVMPTFTEMKEICGNQGEAFQMFNAWLSDTYHTVQTMTFPYGNHYGWCIAHHIKKKLICNVFPEHQSFTVMMRLTNAQFAKAQEDVSAYTIEYIKNRYPCGDGGWIHYRVLEPTHFEDCKKLLEQKWIGSVKTVFKKHS